MKICDLPVVTQLITAKLDPDSALPLASFWNTVHAVQPAPTWDPRNVYLVRTVVLTRQGLVPLGPLNYTECSSLPAASSQ